MIAYRGSPRKERRPKSKEYECTFFTTTFIEAAQYAAGSKAWDDKGWGYVGKYDLGRQHLFDYDDQKLLDEIRGRFKLDWMDILPDEPTKLWVGILSSLGYSGTIDRDLDKVCVFDTSEAEVIDIWRVWPSKTGLSWNKQSVM